VLGPVLGGLIVEYTGYEYRNLFIFGMIFLFFAFLTMLKVKDRAHDEKKRLEAAGGA